MVVVDPIADMLTRIRNANQMRYQEVRVPSSKIKVEIARILKDEGFIADYKIEEAKPQSYITLTLKYTNKKERVITGLKRISKPGLRVYVEAENMPKVLNGFGIAIVSTSKGIMTDKEARKQNVGEVNNNIIKVTGPKGTLETETIKDVVVEVKEGNVYVTRKNEELFTKKMHGTVNANIKNMIEGVTNGYKKSLEIIGVGYRFNLKGNTLVINAGYSHPVELNIPTELKVEAKSNTEIEVSGIDKIKVGEFAANIRKVRKPEPYKGKGIRYVGEHIRRKEGKKAK